MTLTDKEGLLERIKFRSLSLKQKIIFPIILAFAVLTCFLDDMRVLKHIWIAGSAAALLYHLYNRFILPKLIRESAIFQGSHVKANCFVFICSLTLSSFCGSGIMTAVLNLLAFCAFCRIVLPVLPALFFPILALLGSFVFLALSITNFMHYLVAFPVSLILAATYFVTLKYALNPAQQNGQEAVSDVESLTFLNKEINPEDSRPKVSFNMKELGKALSAILAATPIALLAIYWVILSINPFWMRADRISKFETLNRLPHDQNMRVREVSSLDDLRFYKSKLKAFPMVIKPSICTTNSRNVMKCDNYKCLKDYLMMRLKETPDGSWVIQEYSQNQEGVVFYYKFPYMSSGAIKNIGIRDESVKNSLGDVSGTKLTSKYWPGVFRTDFSDEYVKFFDKMAAKIPGYTGGRFDVMLPDTELKDPRGIEILELNVFFLGCIQEKIVKSAFDELRKIRTSLFQIYIGIVNIAAGYNYLSALGIAFKLPELIYRTRMCGNHEHLLAKP